MKYIVYYDEDVPTSNGVVRSLEKPTKKTKPFMRVSPFNGSNKVHLKFRNEVYSILTDKKPVGIKMRRRLI